MVIGFKEQFVEKILSGRKIHTIREDKHHRWKPGMIMHMATGVRTKKYHQFAEKKVVSIQRIKICYSKGAITYYNGFEIPDIEVNGSFIHIGSQMMELALNDGFKTEYNFLEWFNKDFEGIILHWTDKRY